MVATRCAGTRSSPTTRAPREAQVGNADAYSSNSPDRDHMVRRLDPVAGTRDVAAQANEGTFLHTNVFPQHEVVNQRT